MAGLLDGLFSGESGGGLLDFLRNNALYQQPIGGLQSDQAQYNTPMGAFGQMQAPILQPNQPSPLDNSQWPYGPNGIPSQANAQMQPQQAPMQTPSPAPQGPGLGDRLVAGLRTIGNSGGLINKLADAADAFQTGQVNNPAQQQANMTARFLKAHGVSDTDIAAAVGNGRAPGNPEILKVLMANNVKEKQDFRPANAQERAAAGVIEGQPLYIETNTNKPMFGPAQTNISNTINGEKEQDKALGKGYAERQLEIQKAGFNAPAALGNLNLMEKLTKDPNFYSGFGGGIATKLKQMAVSAGIAGAETASPNELFDKLSKKSVLDAAGGSLGNGFSNGDRMFINGTVPNIENTPEGNKQIIEISRQVQQRNIEVAKQAREYARTHNGRLDSGFEDQIAAYAEKNPLFADVGTKSTGPDMSKARVAPDGNTYVPDPARPGKYLKVTQ